jgi:hypothetical protein
MRLRLARMKEPSRANSGKAKRWQTPEAWLVRLDTALEFGRIACLSLSPLDALSGFPKNLVIPGQDDE